MAIRPVASMKNSFATARAAGDKAMNSDATMEIKGYEGQFHLIKQFPWPELSVAGEVEVPLPMGGAYWQPQQIKTNQQGGITFMETSEGHVQTMLDNILFENGGVFDAVVYEGTPDNYKRMLRITQAFVQIEPTDRDMENRGQILLISGTIYYNFFGEKE